MWVHSYEMYKQDPIKNDKIFFNAPVAIFVASPNNVNAGLASSNMELITNALGLGTFFSGSSIVAAKDNQPILDLLYRTPVPDWSKAPWGLSVLAQVTSI